MKKLKSQLRSLIIKTSSIKAKIILTTLFVVSNLCTPKVGFLPLGAGDFDIFNNIFFPLSHANIFHLACNLLCMWAMRPKYYIVSGVVISFIASLLPEPFMTEPIMGMSGILFAIAGAKYGAYAMGGRLVKNMWLFFVVTAFIPNVACLFHVYCVVMGYCWGWSKESYRLWSTTRTR